MLQLIQNKNDKGIDPVKPSLNVLYFKYQAATPQSHMNSPTMWGGTIITPLDGQQILVIMICVLHIPVLCGICTPITLISV